MAWRTEMTWRASMCERSCSCAFRVAFETTTASNYELFDASRLVLIDVNVFCCCEDRSVRKTALAGELVDHPDPVPMIGKPRTSECEGPWSRSATQDQPILLAYVDQSPSHYQAPSYHLCLHSVFGPTCDYILTPLPSDIHPMTSNHTRWSVDSGHCLAV